MLGSHYELSSSCADDDWDCGGGGSGALSGILLGALTAMVIDDGFLGRAHAIEKPVSSWSPRVSIAPTREHQVGSVSLGVAGQF